MTLIDKAEALAVMQKAVDGYGQKMRDAIDKKEKRDWQSMLFAAVDIQHAIAALEPSNLPDIDTFALENSNE